MSAALGGFISGMTGGLQMQQDLRDAREEREDRKAAREARAGAAAEDGLTGAPGSAPAIGDFKLSDAGMASRLRQGLIDRGLPAHVADGWVMNYQDESGLNPGVNEASPVVAGSRGGFGLNQWTGPRRVAYEAYAKERGVAPVDIDAQLDFQMAELKGPERGAYDAIMQTKSAGEAASVIAAKFLRPAESHLAARQARYRQVDQQAAALASSRYGAVTGRDLGSDIAFAARQGITGVA